MDVKKSVQYIENIVMLIAYLFESDPIQQKQHTLADPALFDNRSFSLAVRRNPPTPGDRRPINLTNLRLSSLPRIGSTGPVSSEAQAPSAFTLNTLEELHKTFAKRPCTKLHTLGERRFWPADLRKLVSLLLDADPHSNETHRQCGPDRPLSKEPW